jgi:glucose/arabinose dehydrogenase
MSQKTLSTILHTIEALAALGVALYVAHAFPEYQPQALVVAFGLLSLLAKGARVSDKVAIPDYVNPPKE